MNFTLTPLAGLVVIELSPKRDDRGMFVRTFCQEELKEQGLGFNIVQVNRSITVKKGTVRGLHLQTSPYEEEKIIQCINGSIHDVVVDLRKGSLTYGKTYSIELTENNYKALLIPKGFAHGFQALTENVQVEYFMSQVYSPEHASGVRWDDPTFGIYWPLEVSEVSARDKEWPLMRSKK